MGKGSESSFLQTWYRCGIKDGKDLSCTAIVCVAFLVRKAIFGAC